MWFLILSGSLVMQDSFYFWDGDDLVINILGTPGASRDAILKPRGNELKVSVAAAPEQGKATAAMVVFLARQFGVSPARVIVLAGETSPHKRMRIIAPARIPDRLCGLIKQP